jgi:heterodisulfide reductase subunit A
MYAIKEAMVAKEKSADAIETTILYMDMRTFGKSYQRYRDRAETEGGVRFERGRVHSVDFDTDSKDLVIRYVDTGGQVRESRQDLVVLAVGQRPASGTAELAEMLEIPLNSWGFGQTAPLSLTCTERDGVVLGGSFSGLKDISESVIQASAAALNASRFIHRSGGGLQPEAEGSLLPRDVAREVPNVLIVLCTCGGTLAEDATLTDLQQLAGEDPLVMGVKQIEKTCTAEGWDALVQLVETHRPNRLLIGACLPYVYTRKIHELARQVGLDPSLMDVVDIRSVAFPEVQGSPAGEERPSPLHSMLSILKMGLARLKRIDPSRQAALPVQQRALVVGGGVAGMSAALAVADHGFPVDLLERQDRLGGNLNWLKRTIEGYDTQALLEDMCRKVEKHPSIQVHMQSRILASYGRVGQFFTTVETKDQDPETLAHGVVILASGGSEAPTTAYGYGTSERIVTQKELTQKLADGGIDAGQLQSVVMIQCVDSRQEPRNYCSRVCCTAALKHALQLKEQNPDVSIYVLYRDMMSYGFTETFYTEARRKDVCFIQYTLDNKPRVAGDENSARVAVFEPIIAETVEIEADLVVLATGIVPHLPAELAEAFGAGCDRDGFFQEAESKWRPVDALKEGVFACGLCHSPRSIPEAIDTAEAAAQRSLRILSRKSLPTSQIIAKVHRSLCSLCERCIEACPYGARMLDIEQDQVLVNPAMCQGCGNCATVCPNKASFLEGFRQEQMFEVIDAALIGS